MTKIIVTHINPDLDAICSLWLLKKFHPDFKEADTVFVPAGETYKNGRVDSNENVVHVDTGEGKFDHHQLIEKTCSAELLFKYLKSKFKYLEKDGALIRLIKLVVEIDHFGECLWPQADADYYELGITEILNGLKLGGILDDNGLINFGGKCLEGIYSSLKMKVEAEEELQKGKEFQTQWGKGIACLTANSAVIKLGQKKGFILVVQKDPETELVRIKARPDSKVDLTQAYGKFKKLDPQATWFLHISKKMLLNGSTRNPKMKPTSLSLTILIKVLRDNGKGVFS